MSAPIVISDDEDATPVPYEVVLLEQVNVEETKATFSASVPITEKLSPGFEVKQKKSAAIRNLFRRKNTKHLETNVTVNQLAKVSGTAVHKASITPISESAGPSTATDFKKDVEKIKDPGIHRMIEGVNVKLPVNPYGSQVALMSMLIKAIKRDQNCLLESPTGSGKTLALLCGALAWVSNEKNNRAQIQAQQYFSDHPCLNDVEGAKEYVASPMKTEELFAHKNFGKKSIYDHPEQGNGDGAVNLQQYAYEDKAGLVKLHKRKRDDSEKPITPEKKTKNDVEHSPQQIRDLIENLHIRTSMFVSSSVPTIYYGARTHKQLQQVIKEFRRTVYSREMKMSLLASREYSCIREFDKSAWKTKNDMCKGCVKQNRKKGSNVTNCVYYDNRLKLNHSRLPPTFDLEDLTKAGHELTACPYFAAREMAAVADIVFCPYNYLIDAGIRSSMRINLQNNIVIIDEAHNIEDTCREAATFTFKRTDILTALGELEHVANQRYQNDEAMSYIDFLVKTLKDWDYWFVNQTAILENLPINNNEAIHKWQVQHFIKTLDNHNIGFKDYRLFKENAQMFLMKLRDEPDSLFGVSSATGSLIESIDTALGYLFREECKFADDFAPALVRTVTGSFNNGSWRTSNFRKSVETDTISLRLICMNPAVVFESLKVSKCIVLASGTLTPLISLHSELGTEFPLTVSPSHVIPGDRVWIGTLNTHPDGRTLECKSRDTNQIDTQDTLGETILWVCSVTPHGVLCFVPSYQLLNTLIRRWTETGVWARLNELKNVFQESRNVKDHNEVMEDYYSAVNSDRGGLLFAVYRGKVSEGMDFKDHQARAVVTIGIPYPNAYDMAVKAKMDYNDKYAKERKLLTGSDWLKVQAYRALNQAVGRCVRHRADWGAVLMVDARFGAARYTDHLSKWVANFLAGNHHSFQSLLNNRNSLESFMQNMKIKDAEDNL